MRRVAHAILLSVALAVSQVARAEWRVETRTDSMTDEVESTVATRNVTGHSLSFYRLGKAIWMNFRLSDGSSDILGSRAPMYRIDRNKPRDLEVDRQLQRVIAGTVDIYAQEPKWINAVVWAGEGIPGSSIREILDGSELVVRYHLFTGGYKETAFSLNGLKEAMSTAYGIQFDVDPSAVEDDRALRVAFSAKLKGCFSDYRGRPELEACRAEALACVKSSKTVAEFDVCVAAQ